MATGSKLARGQQSSCADPVLDLYTTASGVQIDVASLEFVIFELVTDAEDPTQVYPALGRASVDVDNPCDDGGGRISIGHYVADWTVPDDALIGSYALTWYFKRTDGSPEQTYTEIFEVVAVVGGHRHDLYTTVQALRDEGVPTSKASDDLCLARIEVASRLIDRWTKRFFYPRSMELAIDGRDLDTVRTGHPIISVESIGLRYDDSEEPNQIDLSSIRIYNRHLDGLTDPDDRNDPRIQMYYPDASLARISPEFAYFPRGRQNVVVRGVFGYTDPNGTAAGQTPILIQEATKRMAIRSLPKMAKTVNNATAGTIWKQQTRQQRVEYGEPSKMAIQGAFTGDPEIDQIIASYRRPPTLGAPQGRYRRAHAR